jgi:hypothetical protein
MAGLNVSRETFRPVLSVHFVEFVWVAVKFPEAYNVSRETLYARIPSKIIIIEIQGSFPKN